MSPMGWILIHPCPLFAPCYGDMTQITSGQDQQYLIPHEDV